MRILIAEDDPPSRLTLEKRLEQWGHEVVVTVDGREARSVLEGDDHPRLAILDWMMPMLTALDAREDIVEGLRAGADDYLIKPPDGNELRARIDVGIRVLELQSELSDRVAELEASLAREKHLQGLLPICSYCKKIRDDKDYWQQVEGYIEDHADVSFSHGICPVCYVSIVQPQLDRLDSGAAE